MVSVTQLKFSPSAIGMATHQKDYLRVYIEIHPMTLLVPLLSLMVCVFLYMCVYMCIIIMHVCVCVY